MVGPKNLTATVEFSAKARLTSENAEDNWYRQALPGLSKHLLAGDADARLYIAKDTEVAPA